MSGSLTDHDPETPARERRWPFYLAWVVGGAVIGGVLLTHLPASFVRPLTAPVAGPAIIASRVPTAAPAALRLAAPIPVTPLRVAPAPVAPARP